MPALTALAAVVVMGVAASQELVSFSTQDGGLVYADLYGQGDHGVVLAHGGRFDKASWEPQARALAAAQAAVEAAPGEIDGLVLLAHSPIDEPERMKGRKLFITSRGDLDGRGVPRLEQIHEQYERAPGPKELVILDGSAHAQFIFETEQGERLLREILRFLTAGSNPQIRAIPSVPACTDIWVSLAAVTPRIKSGERPQFSAEVVNKTSHTTRVLDVRNGRRVDLQHTYFQLLVTESAGAVDVPIFISDPGPLSPADFLDLEPGARVEFRSIAYKLGLETLPRGDYEAVILFWRDPLEPPTTRCRSTAARFTVFE